jgi:DNA-binding IclR family transcriptional regulator
MREDPSSGYASGPEIPDEMRLLCMLHNIGATESGKSLTIQQISEWTRMDTPTLQFHLQKLSELGYVQFIQAEGIDKYHLTLDGIRKVLSIYS